MGSRAVNSLVLVSGLLGLGLGLASVATFVALLIINVGPQKPVFLTALLSGSLGMFLVCLSHELTDRSAYEILASGKGEEH